MGSKKTRRNTRKHSRNNQMRCEQLENRLLLAADFEFRTIDGTDNHPMDLGSAETVLLRVAPADYPGDGSGTTIIEAPDRPNPREISNTVLDQQGVSILNNRRLSDFVWQWGQFLDHDIDLTPTSAANGTADISIPAFDPFFDPMGTGTVVLPFARSDFDPSTGTAGNPRQQINAITAFIDASNVYGSDPATASALRTFVDGKLATSAGGQLLPVVAGQFVGGDVRVNEQVGLTAMHTLFMREHNRLAELLAAEPDIDAKAADAGLSRDEFIYQVARKIVGAEMQIITYNEFLPALLGDAAPAASGYSYSASVNPSIATEFSTALYRFGHSMLSPGLLLVDKLDQTDSLALRDAFFNPSFIGGADLDNPVDTGNVERLLYGLASQRAQEVDGKVVDDVRSFLFGPPGSGGLDLASLNMQRGRDHGLPDYNSVRVAFGLAAKTAFLETGGGNGITSDPVLATALQTAYGSVDNIDPWVGGLSEDHLPSGSTGQLITVVLRDQFIRLRDGDRFYYYSEPDLQHEIVSRVIDLDKFTLAQVIRDNTGITSLQDNVFFTTAAVAQGIFVSSYASGCVDGIEFDDEDILSFNTGSQEWSLYFDGSDVFNTREDVSAFHLLPDGSILMSFDQFADLPGLGRVDGADVVKFIPTSLGSHTAGTFEWFFDGSDVGLTARTEKIDSLSLLPDGRLLLGFVDKVSVPGVSAADEDLLAFTPASLGTNTAGTWELYFDGSDVGLGGRNMDINAAWTDPGTGDLYLSTLSKFSQGTLNTGPSDVFKFVSTSLGGTTSGSFQEFWRGADHGLGGQQIDGLSVAELLFDRTNPGFRVTPSARIVTSEDGTNVSISVSLTEAPTADVVVPVHSNKPDEAKVSTTQLVFTPANWNVPQVFSVTGVDDPFDDGDITYTIVLGKAESIDPVYDGLNPANVHGLNLDNEVPPTKFYVVDDGMGDRTYEYGATGSTVENYELNINNWAPRGAASTVAGDRVWVIDANRTVYVYDANGGLLGSWTAGSLPRKAKLEGIATDGTDIWLVDASSDKVYRYDGAAGRLAGSQNAASSFKLNRSNRAPMDVVTDGTHLWVVDDSRTDRVFKYTVAGQLVGSWSIGLAVPNPTGITIDPANVSDIWIVDNATDSVYQYTGATTRTSGSQNPDAWFALAPGNTNPQGIADPPSPHAVASNSSVQPSNESARVAELQRLADIGFASLSTGLSRATNARTTTVDKLTRGPSTRSADLLPTLLRTIPSKRLDDFIGHPTGLDVTSSDADSLTVDEAIELAFADAGFAHALVLQ